MYVFGYGSLVNAATHGFGDLTMAQASGWRRAWVATPDRALCYLTAVADETARIDGLLASVPMAERASLDQREAAYDRHDGAPWVQHNSAAQDIAIYAIAPHRQGPPGPENPILLSYLDTVIAGYLAVFGEQGAMGFFDTTSGWRAPVLNDRDKPRYPRAVTLTDEVRALTDQGMAGQRCRIISAD